MDQIGFWCEDYYRALLLGGLDLPKAWKTSQRWNVKLRKIFSQLSVTSLFILWLHRMHSTDVDYCDRCQTQHVLCMLDTQQAVQKQMNRL